MCEIAAAISKGGGKGGETVSSFFRAFHGPAFPRSVVAQFENWALSNIRRYGLARPICPPSRGWEQPPKRQPNRTMRHGMLH